MKARRTTSGLERRDISGEQPSITDDGKIRGLAVPFNSWTTIGYGPMRFRERIAPSAVTKTLREADVVYLDNHDTAKPLARKSAGNLDVVVTERGVEYLADPSDTSYARDLKVNIRAKNILGNSFGFEPVKDKWEIGADGVDERTLLEMKLPEISSCTFPAYEDTEIGMRDTCEAAMEARSRYYASLEDRAKYSEAEVEALGKKGKAFRNPDGHYSFPVNDEEDLHNAIHAVGRGGADHDAIRAYIIRRAKALGLSSAIPDNWNSDGSMSDNERETEAPEEQRAVPDYVTLAIAHLDAGDHEAARAALQGAQDDDETEEAEEYYPSEDSQGMVAHTTQGGSSVPLREAEQLYELIRTQFPATRATNEALAILEPLLSTPEEGEQRGDPKPESSTSEIKLDDEKGVELWERMTRTQRAYR